MENLKQKSAAESPIISIVTTVIPLLYWPHVLEIKPLDEALSAPNFIKWFFCQVSEPKMMLLNPPVSSLCGGWRGWRRRSGRGGGGGQRLLHWVLYSTSTFFFSSISCSSCALKHRRTREREEKTVSRMLFQVITSGSAIKPSLIITAMIKSKQH